MHSIDRFTRVAAVAALAGAAALSGCASFNAVSSDVASYGTWPAGQAPGTYSFDRLPSQQKNPLRQQSLETAAAQALEPLGFKPAPEGSKGDVTVQLGARIERYETAPWDDPFWVPGLYRGYAFPGPWIAPYGPYGYGPGPYGGFGPYSPFWRPWPDNDRYQREVALLIREGATGKPLYETRATSDGLTSGGDRVLAAMFGAALQDFPQSNDRSHSVTVEMPPR